MSCSVHEKPGFCNLGRGQGLIKPVGKINCPSTNEEVYYSIHLGLQLERVESKSEQNKIIVLLKLSVLYHN